MHDPSPLRVPDEAVNLILLQRTKLQFMSQARARLPFALPAWTATVESRIRRRSIKQEYADETIAEYEALRPFLPDRCSAILDIGCGVAGIDALLYGHYLARVPPLLYLLDRSETSPRPKYGFEPNPSYYNSLSVAARMLSSNGVDPDRVKLVEAGSPEMATIGGVDLTISLISWGFHYPVSTYIDLVDEVSSPDARVILDVRKDTGGDREIGAAFPRIEVIMEDGKRKRIVATRDGG